MPRIPDTFERGERIFVATEAVNAYGFRMLVDGGDYSAFDPNPVMLFNHLRSTGWEPGETKYPIGAWEDRQVDGQNRLSLVPIFNTEYEEGAKVAQMYRDGFLNTASVSIEILALDESEEAMVPGQIRPTVTKWRLREVSITDIPANHTCYKVSYKGKEVTLSAKSDDESQSALNEILPIITNQKSTTMDGIQMAAATLGMSKPEDVTAAQLVAKVTEMKNQNAALTAERDSMKQERDDLKAQLDQVQEDSRSAQLTALLDAAVNDGKITKAQRPVYENLGKQDYENVKSLLDGMQAYTRPNGQVDGAPPAGGAANTTEALAKRFQELDKEGKIAGLPTEERELLAEAYLNWRASQGKIKRKQ